MGVYVACFRPINRFPLPKQFLMAYSDREACRTCTIPVLKRETGDKFL
jgi:hypothetical protein